MSGHPAAAVATPGLQHVDADAAPSASGAHLARSLLEGATSVSESMELIARHFLDDPRVDAVAAAMTTFAPEDTQGWAHLGQRAWVKEWKRPGSICRIMPPEGSGPEAALTMPWVSPLARHDVVSIADSEQLPDPAEQDKRELRGCNARALIVASQLSRGEMFGSISVVSAEPGLWPEECVADLRLLSAAMTSRLLTEKAQRSLADAIAVGDQARASQQQFFATIGHELRTPLTAIVGYAEMLGEEAEAGDPDDELATTVTRDSKVILRAGEQLLAIVEDLLATGRQLGQEEPREDIDLSAAVADVLHWHRTPATSNAVTVRSGVRPGLVVHARPSGLLQVLTNLVGNAIVYNHRGGEVVVDAEPMKGESGEGRLRITVRDTGPGLTADQARRVFDPFVRFAPEVRGTGLGLPLARAVAERDGGVMGVESTPGAGSVFWVDLPVTAADRP